MSNLFEQYDHGWGLIWVRSDLRGRHREFCACYQCSKFWPNRPDNCPRAQATYEHDVKWGCVTPMWECPDFGGDSQ